MHGVLCRRGDIRNFRIKNDEVVVLNVGSKEPISPESKTDIHVQFTLLSLLDAIESVYNVFIENIEIV